jgi:transcription-repair coupling factor (superfamily II helicase)
MKAYLEPLREISEYCEVEKVLQGGGKPALVTGCIDSQKCHLIAGLSEHFPVRLIITYSDLKARELCEEYRLYDAGVVCYPSKDIIFYNADIHGNAIVKERLQVVKKLLAGEPVTVIASIDGGIAYFGKGSGYSWLGIFGFVCGGVNRMVCIAVFNRYGSK